MHASNVNDNGYGLVFLTYFIVVVNFLRPWDFLPFLVPLHLTLVVCFLSIVYLVFSGTLSKLWLEKIPGLRLVTVYWIAGGVGIFTSYYRRGSFEAFQSELSLFVMYLLLIAMSLNKTHPVRKLSGILVVVMDTHAAFLIKDYLINGMGSYRPDGIIKGLFENANHLGCFFVMTLPLAYLCFIKSNSFLKKAFYMGSIFLILVAVVATQSRGAMLTLVVLCIAWFMLSKGKQKFALLFFLSVIMFGIMLWTPVGNFERFSVKNYSGEDHSAKGRVYVWKKSIPMLLDNPLTGVGVGQFGLALNQDYLDDEYFNELAGSLGANPMLRAHNMYVSVWAEMGMLGFLPFLLIWLTFTKKLYGIQRQAELPESQSVRLILLALLGFMISNMFDHLAHSAATYYLFAIAGLGQLNAPKIESNSHSVKYH